tara:strand:- start:221 stop:610 length:390 start_codon:yes stop_codon:yes gene_type:complete
MIIVGVGYRGLFWLDGITCILAGLLFIKILNPKKAPVTEEVSISKLQSAYTDGKFLLFVIAILLFAMAFMQYFSTIPLYYKYGHHLTEFQIGLLFPGNGFLVFLLEMPLVKWLENSGNTKTFLMILGSY